MHVLPMKPTAHFWLLRLRAAFACPILKSGVSRLRWPKFRTRKRVSHPAKNLCNRYTAPLPDGSLWFTGSRVVGRTCHFWKGAQAYLPT